MRRRRDPSSNEDLIRLGHQALRELEEPRRRTGRSPMSDALLVFEDAMRERGPSFEPLADLVHEARSAREKRRRVEQILARLRQTDAPPRPKVLWWMRSLGGSTLAVPVTPLSGESRGWQHVRGLAGGAKDRSFTVATSELTRYLPSRARVVSGGAEFKSPHLSEGSDYATALRLQQTINRQSPYGVSPSLPAVRRWLLQAQRLERAIRLQNPSDISFRWAGPDLERAAKLLEGPISPSPSERERAKGFIFQALNALRGAAERIPYDTLRDAPRARLRTLARRMESATGRRILR